jgi:clan AA aspartic protease
MIEGMVTAEREPIVRIRVVGATSEFVVDAVLDTGFNDFLTLSPEMIFALNLKEAAPLEATLADGSTVQAVGYSVIVWWDGHPRDVIALQFSSKVLIGMALLEGYDVHIEAVERGEVSIVKRQ